MAAICHLNIFAELQEFEALIDEETNFNGGFKGTVLRHLDFVLPKELGVKVEVSPVRLKEAHRSWLRDLDRVSSHEMEAGPLDQYKRCAYLTYWIKRKSPIIKYEPSAEVLEGLSAQDVHYVDFMSRYANEHLAFTLAFEICLYFLMAAREQAGFKMRKDAVVYNQKFVHDLHYAQKEKNISPHALNLIYRSIFA